MSTEVKMRISWEIVGKTCNPDHALQVIDAVGEELFAGYTQLTWVQWCRIWKIDFDDRDMVACIRGKMQRLLEPEEFLQENVSLELPCADLNVSSYCVLRLFANDASNAEITHHTDSELICPACGNKYQNAYFVPAIRPERLPASPKLMSFYGSLKLFCREPFLEKYEKAGLTGFSFEDWETCDKHKVPLYLIRVPQHKWQDRTGVCDTCEMKTNVTTPEGLFNCHESFQYDIQHIRTYRSDAFVLSRRAIEFFSRCSSMMKTILNPPPSMSPIVPGYREDEVWPEPKLFAHGKMPLHMLRSSWQSKNQI